MSKHRKNQQLAKELQKRKKSKTDSVDTKVETPKTQSVKTKKRGRPRKTQLKPKRKKQYGVIVSLPESKYSMDYLIGRRVKVLEHSTDSILYCTIQHPGYEGLELAFNPNEIEITTNGKVDNKFFND